MHILPFDKPGRFYKGNLHTHSTLSDGALSPEAVCDLYRNAGYDFIALTDHFMKAFNFTIADTRPYRSENFTTIIGAELHTGRTEFGQLWHILAVGLPLDFAQYLPDETGPQIAERAMDAGAFVAVAHPNWYSLTENDVVSLGDVHAIEIINGTSVDHNDKADSLYMLDVMLTRGRRYTACATDDTHSQLHRQDAFIGWVQVKSEALTPEALLNALKAGHYYSSTGAEIHDVQIYPGDKAIVKCSPASRVFITGSGYFAESVFGENLTEVELSLKNFKSPYARITVRNAEGGRAWTNPFWFSE